MTTQHILEIETHPDGHTRARCSCGWIAASGEPWRGHLQSLQTSPCGLWPADPDETAIAESCARVEEQASKSRKELKAEMKAARETLTQHCVNYYTTEVPVSRVEDLLISQFADAYNEANDRWNDMRKVRKRL